MDKEYRARRILLFGGIPEKLLLKVSFPGVKQDKYKYEGRLQVKDLFMVVFTAVNNHMERDLKSGEV